LKDQLPHIIIFIACWINITHYTKRKQILLYIFFYFTNIIIQGVTLSFKTKPHYC